MQSRKPTNRKMIYHSKLVNMFKKKTNTNSLIEKLDDIFSKYIRLRDSDNNGRCKCISCNLVMEWKFMHNGHYINRVHKSTRFDERNCNAQCVECNMYSDGNLENYKRGLIRKYGVKVVSELEDKKNIISDNKSSDYIFMIDYYKEKVKQLLKEKS